MPDQTYHEYYVDKIADLEESSNVDSWLKFYQYLSHLSYLYLSMFCFLVSMIVRDFTKKSKVLKKVPVKSIIIVGLTISCLTGGLSEDYRRSHPTVMFNTFFPKSFYEPKKVQLEMENEQQLFDE